MLINECQLTLTNKHLSSFYGIILMSYESQIIEISSNLCLFMRDLYGFVYAHRHLVMSLHDRCLMETETQGSKCV